MDDRIRTHEIIKNLEGYICIIVFFLETENDPVIRKA